MTHNDCMYASSLVAGEMDRAWPEQKRQAGCLEGTGGNFGEEFLQCRLTSKDTRENKIERRNTTDGKSQALVHLRTVREWTRKRKQATPGLPC